MVDYYVNSHKVSRDEALHVWVTSRTYALARADTRGNIFCDAENGINDSGELNHLREAGIILKFPPARVTAKGERNENR